MALNLDAVGKAVDPVTKAYTWKDAVLYALAGRQQGESGRHPSR